MEDLLNYIFKGPVWRFHSLLRALHLTEQDHVIKEYQDKPHGQVIILLGISFIVSWHMVNGRSLLSLVPPYNIF